MYILNRRQIHMAVHISETWLTYLQQFEYVWNNLNCWFLAGVVGKNVFGELLMVFGDIWLNLQKNYKKLILCI